MTSDEYKINHNYEIAMRNLNSAGWETMSETEKIADLQAIEDKNALDNNRIPADVRGEALRQGEYGYQLENTITVNTNELNNMDETVKTVYHEGEHIKGDFQAEFIPEVREQYTPEELAARNTPIPDPDVDYNGYYNHPAEIAAREAEIDGINKTMADQEHIAEIDEQMHADHTTNQILETYDYIALDMPTENDCEQEVSYSSEWTYDTDISETVSYEDNTFDMDNSMDWECDADNNSDVAAESEADFDAGIDSSDDSDN